jgi:head-tail adaptor
VDPHVEGATTLMGIRAGKFRYLLAIERLTGAQDSTGAEMQVYSTYTKAWGWIEPYIGSARAGREVFTAEGQLVGLDYTRIHMRYIPGVGPKDRVRYGTRLFDILAINNRDEQNFEIEMIAKERQSNQ